MPYKELARRLEGLGVRIGAKFLAKRITRFFCVRLRRGSADGAGLDELQLADPAGEAEELTATGGQGTRVLRRSGSGQSSRRGATADSNRRVAEGGAGAHPQEGR